MVQGEMKDVSLLVKFIVKMHYRNRFQVRGGVSYFLCDANLTNFHTIIYLGSLRTLYSKTYTGRATNARRQRIVAM